MCNACTFWIINLKNDRGAYKDDKKGTRQCLNRRIEPIEINEQTNEDCAKTQMLCKTCTKIEFVMFFI